MGRKVKNHEWFDDQAYQDWIAKFQDQKKYRRNFANWVNWIGLTPSEQIEKRKEDLKNEDMQVKRYFEEKLKEYGKEIMQQGITRKTGLQYLIAVRSFFSHNYMPLVFARNELKHEEIKEVKQNHKPKWVLDNLELRTLFNVCNPRDKPLLLFSSSTGMSPIDVCQIKIDNLRIYKKDYSGKFEGISEVDVYGEKERDKTDILQQFVIGEEVLFYLNPILSERGYPESGYLFITQKGNPYEPRSISERLGELAIKAFGDERAKDFQVKNLRDYFQNALIQSGVNDKVIDSMMGWKKAGAKEHYKISQETILQAYNLARSRLSIDGNRKTNDQIKRLEIKIGQLTMQYEELRDAIPTMIEKTFEKFFEEFTDKKVKVKAEIKEI